MGLIDQIRAARQRSVTVGERSFTVRRPTDLEVAEMQGKPPSPFAIVLRFTVGWSLKESDLIEGGADAAVPWDADLFSEWVADQPELWEPLSSEVLNGYAAHRDRSEGATKN